MNSELLADLINSYTTKGIIVLAVFFGISVATLVVFLAVSSFHRRYRNFVLTNSAALKMLKSINSRYRFKKADEINLSNRYDNENFYDTISCEDYLTYQLVYMQKKVNSGIKAARENKVLFEQYKEEIQQKCIFMDFGDVVPLKNKKLLEKKERRFFKKECLAPTISFRIVVHLDLVNINGEYKTSKSKAFYEKDIESIECRLNQRRNGFYLDENVWKSICRVERGKVTNKMRFAIYSRDGYRCQKCGRKTNDLEIDHIIPIAKGGKSAMSNLQTLCHRCNVRKGSNIE